MADNANSMYSFEEYTDMILIYGKVNKNGFAAVQEYRDTFPRRRTPDRKTFEAVERRLRETGCFKPKRIDTGRKRSARNHNNEQAIINAVQLSPTTSTRRVSLHLNISQSSVWRTLHETQLYPFHITRVQDLLPQDLNKRKIFCRWLRRKCLQHQYFLRRILVTDESCFTRNGIVNFRNTHSWAYENPHETVSRHFQHTFSVNVWLGVLGDNFIGPFFLPNRLTGEAYLHFLRTTLPTLLEDISLENRLDVWFMHDGAPPHFSNNVKDYLNNTYGRKWIGRNGPVKWPPRSPDLTPADFFLWGWMKAIVYSKRINTQEELRNRITEAAETMKNTPNVMRRARKEWIRRAKTCIDKNGGHFEQLL
jgi:hypothetical protein